jgi:hypothetical protein
MIELILFCLGTASLAHFYQKCMDDGMILEKWHTWTQKFPTPIYKVISGCIFCNGTWLFLGLFLFSHRVETNYLGLILGIGFNYVWIEVIYKLR